MIFDTDGGRIVNQSQDFSHPISEGYFCIKGKFAADFMNGGEPRLLQSLRRQSDGRFTEISNADATDQIGEKLRGLLDQHGPRSIGLFYGTGAYYNTLGMALARAFLSAIDSPNLFGTMTIDQSAKWVSAGRMGVMLSGKRTLFEADTILIVGANPIVSHQGYPYLPTPPHNPGRNLRKYKSTGGRVIVIDPRRSETARLADIHLQPVPGEDAAVLAGLINIVIENAWFDSAFCARFVTQFNELRAAVAPFSPVYVASRSGVSEEDLIATARLFSQSGKSASGSGTGLNMGPHSNVAEHLLEALSAICGAYRRAGESIAASGTIFPKRLKEKIVPAIRVWEGGPKCISRDIGKLNGEFPSALLSDEILNDDKDRIRALIVFAGNPALAISEPDKTLKALSKLELLVTIDPRMTETAARSHYVIAPALQFERHDIGWISDICADKPFAQYTRPVVEKPIGVVHEWEFFWDILNYLRRDVPFKYCPVGFDYGKLPGGEVLAVTTKPSAEILIAKLMQRGPIAFEDFEADGGWITPDAPPIVVEPAGLDDGARLELCPPDVSAEVNAILADEASRDKSSFRLSARRSLQTMNSAFRYVETTQNNAANRQAWLNPQDIEMAGAKSGDRVEITSKYGVVSSIARGDASIRPGVVSMSHMWGTLDPSDDPTGASGGHTGRLVSISDALEAINYMPTQTGFPVTLKFFRDH